MRTELSPDGEELIVHIPVRVLAELLRPRIGAREANLDPLSVRERVVFKLLRSGQANKEIASEIHVSVSTVKFHISNIYKKLGIRGRREVFCLYG